MAVSFGGTGLIALAQNYFGIVAVFAFAVTTVAILGLALIISQLYNNLKKTKTYGKVH